MSERQMLLIIVEEIEKDKRYNIYPKDEPESKKTASNLGDAINKAAELAIEGNRKALLIGIPENLLIHKSQGQKILDEIRRKEVNGPDKKPIDLL